MTHLDLKELAVMVTRPAPQGQVLCDRIAAEGGKAIFFPTIEIVSAVESPDMTAILTTLDQFDWLIFISPQAVYQAVNKIKAQWPVFPLQLKVAALGGGTAQALHAVNWPVHVYPKEAWESEGLLALPEFQQMNGCKVVLVRGEGGRALLTEELTRRGATLTHLMVYSRCLPTVEAAPYLSLLRAKEIDIIVTTSHEILHNLTVLLATQAMSDLLYAVPVVVVSDRMAVQAKNMGFKTIIIAQNAGHDAIMATLKDYLWQMKLKKQ